MSNFSFITEYFSNVSNLLTREDEINHHYRMMILGNVVIGLGLYPISFFMIMLGMLFGNGLSSYVFQPMIFGTVLIVLSLLLLSNSSLKQNFGRFTLILSFCGLISYLLIRYYNDVIKFGRTKFGKELIQVDGIAFYINPASIIDLGIVMVGLIEIIVLALFPKIRK